MLSSELGAGPFMAGNQFTALDIVFGYNMEVFSFFKLDSSCLSSPELILSLVIYFHVQ